MKYFILAFFLLISSGLSAQIFQRNTGTLNEKGKTSWASSWGDYDNDGDIDLYVSNYYNQNFLYRNNGDKTFTKITTGALVGSSSVGHWSSSWVDYDDDGDLDLYVINSYTSNGELIRNNGNGTFTSISSAIINTSLIDDNNAAWADTDNDGDLDLLLANGSNSTPQTRNQNNSYYINNGDGTFTQNTTSVIATDGGFSQFANFGDYDNDGDADLIVINTFQDNFFYENNGNGSFTKILNQPFLSTGEQPLTACWGDFNNDTYLDLVIGSYTSSRIYYNNGDKTFRTGTFPGISGNATGVSIGDFNLDGYQDVVFIRTGQGALYYLNNGNETFTNSNAGDLTSIALDYTNSGAVGDYDNDGDLDIYINNDDTENLLLENTEVTGNWVAFKLQGTISNSQGVGAKVRIKVNNQWQTREVGIMSSYRTQNSIHAHFGMGSAPKIDSIRVLWPSGKIQNITTINKINAIITINEGIDYYDFKEATSSVINTDSYNTYSNSWADYDNDGDLDVLTGNVSTSRAINLYQNQGNGTFIDKVTTAIPNLTGSVYSSSWGDYDNDGDADLFVTNNDLDKPNALYRNNGNGTFAKIATVEILNEITYSEGSSWADYNNDGKLDMFVANWHYLYPDKSNSLYKGDGAGGFTKITSTVISQDLGVASFRMGWSDVDNDGDADILVEVVAQQKNILYRNNNDGTFTKDLLWDAIGRSDIGAAFGDYDNDGDQDVYLSGTDALFNNNGLGVFTKVQGTPFAIEHSEAAIWGDYDNDGDLDIYLANGGGAFLNSLYRNNGDGTFSKINSAATRDLSNSRSALWVDVNNDNYLDLFVGNIGQNKMFLNAGGNLHGLQINLRGVQSNGLGTGAKVKIKVGNKWQLREVFSQQSASLRTHFGLGSATKADLVRIDWPSGNVQLLQNVAADQIITLTETNSPNSPHSLDFALSSNEDEQILFQTSDFINAFNDTDGDRIKEIKISTLSDKGQLLLNSAPVTIGQVIGLKGTDEFKFIPTSHFAGETGFTFEAIDYRGLSILASASITINPINDAPVISSISDVFKNTSGPGELISVEFNVTDIDNLASELSLSVSSSNQSVVPASAIAFAGSGNTRTLTFAVIKGGTSSITITVSDGTLQASTSFNVTINTPHLLNLNLQTNEDEALQFHSSDFSDALVDAEGDQLKEIKIITLPQHGNLTFKSANAVKDMVIAYAELGDLKFIPEANFYGNTLFDFSSMDHRGLSVNSKVSINLLPVNDAPVISAISDVLKEMVNEGDVLSISFAISDVDNDLSSLKVFASIVNGTVIQSKNITITGNSSSRILNIILDKPGTTSLTLTVSDDVLNSSSTFKLTILKLITGVEANGNLLLKVYPNPVSENLFISSGINDIKQFGYSILDITGKVLKSGTIQADTNGNGSVGVRELPFGSYVLSCIIDGKVTTSKFVKQ